MDLAELLARLEADGAAALTDEELAFVREGVTGVVASVEDPANPSEEDVAALTSAAAALETIDAELAVRAEAVATRAATAADLIARLTPAADEVVAEDAEAETPAEGEEAPAETEATEGDEPIVVPDDASEITDAQVPVTAAAPRRPALVDLARRRPASARPAPQRTSGTTITASADIPGIGAGQALTAEQLGEAIVSRLRSIRNVPNSDGMRYPVARIATNFPEDRMLSEDNAAENRQKLAAVTAAGGPCAPLEVDYSLGTIGTARRPLRSALPQFGASRGGVRFQQPPQLGDYDAGVSAWTQANDLSAIDGDPTKPCVRIDCGDEVTAITEAIPVCGTIGNWIARNYDERVQAFRDLLGVTAARFTEARHLTRIGAASTQITAVEGLGAIPDILSTLGRHVQVRRDRFRMDDDEPIDFLTHRWVRAVMRADIARELPGRSTQEQWALADAAIESWFGQLGLNPVWLLDGEDGQTFGDQNDGTLQAWPDTAVFYLYPSGSWKHLDDGVLDLSVSGPIRDSTLNSTNDSQIWMETFENVYFQGTWSDRIEMDVCPSGIRQGSSANGVTYLPCTTGS